MKKKEPSTLLRNVEMEEVSHAVKRRLKTISVKTPTLMVLTDALDELKVEYESPGFRGECVAHVVIPSAKIAIFLPYQGISNARLQRNLAGWKEQGYFGAYYLFGQIENLVETKRLKSDLSVAITARKEMLKKGKR